MSNVAMVEIDKKVKAINLKGTFLIDNSFMYLS
jgi:hypothetical protein